MAGPCIFSARRWEMNLFVNVPNWLPKNGPHKRADMHYHVGVTQHNLPAPAVPALWDIRLQFWVLAVWHLSWTPDEFLKCKRAEPLPMGYKAGEGTWDWGRDCTKIAVSGRFFWTRFVHWAVLTALNWNVLNDWEEMEAISKQHRTPGTGK